MEQEMMDRHDMAAASAQPQHREEEQPRPLLQYKLTGAYNAFRFNGFQKQPHPAAALLESINFNFVNECVCVVI
jgi:hypothetical protein